MLERWEQIALRFIRSRLAIILSVVLGLGLGLVLSYQGVNTWDDLVQEAHSNWLLSHYGGLAPRDYVLPYDQLYGPLWSFLLGIFSLPFSFLHDPGLLRHSFTLALYPLGLLLAIRLLLRAGVDLATSILSVSLVFGIVRLGGHALLNVKDFPHAIAFLLVSLYLWIRLSERLQTDQAPLRAWEIFCLSAISLVPYFLRTPLLFHFLGLWIFFLLYVLLVKHSLKTKQVVQLLGLPFFYFILLVVALFPVIWQAGPKPWVHMFIFFSQVYTNGSVRIFDTDYPSQALPRWYSFVWIPLIANPAALLAASVGVISLPWRPLECKRFKLQTRLGELEVPLKLWLVLILVGAWSTVVIKSPRLYDEERHILFIYPMFFLLAGLGLQWLPKAIKYSLAGLVVAWSVGALYMWGPYAYIYKSPLLGQRLGSSFMGDYWGVCLNRVIPKLPRMLPDLHKDIEIPMAMGVARLQERRLHNSLVFRHADFPELQLRDESSALSHYYVLINRQSYLRLPAMEEKYQMKELAREIMPPRDEAACIVYEVTAKAAALLHR